MRIAVTGNLGYIGPVVVEHLAAQGFAELVGIDPGYFAARLTSSGPLPERLLREHRYLDVRTLTPADLAGVDAVVHLAALSNDPLSHRYTALTEEINLRGTSRVAQMARRAGVRRFVFASSCSVYGAPEADLVNEDSPTSPLTPYASSKLAGELGLRELAGAEFAVTCLRFATAYGWSPRLRLDLALNDFTASAVARGEIVLASAGNAWRPFIHVRDMARAIEWALGRQGDPNLCLNAGGTASNYRIGELAESVARLLGGVSVRRAEGAQPDKRSYRVDFSRFESLAAGYAPRETLEYAVPEMAEGLRQMNYTHGSRKVYVRLATLEELQEAGQLDSRLSWQRSPRLCRLCGAGLHLPFADLGQTPLANDYPDASHAGREPYYPLNAWVCTQCWLVQLGHLVPPERIFQDYAYLSSCSPSWVEHARRYAEHAIARLELNAASRVVEVASNDGYLLQHFVAKGIPSLGVEPAANVAEMARQKGIETVTRFFQAESAGELLSEGWQADLIAANNVLAHVADIHGFVAGFAVLLKPEGVATFEFPHLLELIREQQFDTIYHEHYSYFSLIAASRLFEAHGLRVYDVERLSTHGGSLRLWVCRRESDRPTESNVPALLAEEKLAGLDTPQPYLEFAATTERNRNSLRALLDRLQSEGKTVAAYGAAAKGNTLLNYCRVTSDHITFVADRNPIKQGKLLPGSHIPVVDPSVIDSAKPDYVLILPWNLTNEIREQLAGIGQWGGKFIRPVPVVEELA